MGFPITDLGELDFDTFFSYEREQRLECLVTFLSQPLSEIKDDLSKVTEEITRRKDPEVMQELEAAFKASIQRKGAQLKKDYEGGKKTDYDLTGLKEVDFDRLQDPSMMQKFKSGIDKAKRSKPGSPLPSASEPVSEEQELPQIDTRAKRKKKSKKQKGCCILM